MMLELGSFHSAQCLSRFTLCLSGFHSVLISFGTGGEFPAEAKTVSA